MDSSKWLVTIFGPAGAGKTTLATFMEEELKERDITVERLQFSRPLKALVAEMLGVERMDFEEIKHLEEPPTFLDLEPLRSYLQDALLPLTFGEAETLHEIFHEAKTIGEAYRRLLQVVGTDIIRLRNNHKFVDRLLWAAASSDAAVIIVDDGRLKLELKAVARFRDRIPFIIGMRRKRSSGSKVPQHVTEIEARKVVEYLCPITVENNGSLDELRAQARHLVKQLLTDSGIGEVGVLSSRL